MWNNEKLVKYEFNMKLSIKVSSVLPIKLLLQLSILPGIPIESIGLSCFKFV